MSTRLGPAAVSLGAGVIGLVAVLLHRTLIPVREIARYAEDTLDAASGIQRNLEDVTELSRTRELLGEVSGATTRASE
jgi:hypothetical protein